MLSVCSAQRRLIVTDPELETLAQLLAGFGITLNVTDAEGHLLISGPAARRDAHSEPPRTVSMNLADGRRLVLVPDAEAGAATPRRGSAFACSLNTVPID
jgi:hypothetical protein